MRLPTDIITVIPFWIRRERTRLIPSPLKVQVYAGSNGAANGADRPVKLLKGIARVEVPAGEEKAVEIRIPMEELRFWDRGEWILDPAYTIYTGFDSRQAMDCARELELN